MPLLHLEVNGVRYRIMENIPIANLVHQGIYVLYKFDKLMIGAIRIADGHLLQFLQNGQIGYLHVLPGLAHHLEL